MCKSAQLAPLSPKRCAGRGVFVCVCVGGGGVCLHEDMSRTGGVNMLISIGERVNGVIVGGYSNGSTINHLR